MPKKNIFHLIKKSKPALEPDTKSKVIVEVVENIDQPNIEILDTEPSQNIVHTPFEAQTIAEKEFSFDIMNQIQDIKPKTRLYARLRIILFVVLIVLLIILATIALAIFSNDVLEKLTINEFVGNPILEDFLSFLFELLLIVPIGFGLIHFIYRHTDWKFAKEKLGILVASSLLITTLSSGLVFYLKNEEETAPVKYHFNSLKQKLRSGNSIRNGIDQNYQNKLRSANTFSGIITKIEADKITIQGQNSIQEFTFNETDELKVGQKVIVRFHNQNGVNVISKIRVLN